MCHCATEAGTELVFPGSYNSGTARALVETMEVAMKERMVLERNQGEQEETDRHSLKWRESSGVVSNCVTTTMFPLYWLDIRV